MFRILLTAYLSLIAALGPAFCCCSLKHLAGTAGSNGCCLAKSVLAQGRDHHHDHGAHSHHSHQHADAPTDSAASQTDAPPDTALVCSGNDCGCNRDDQRFGLPRSGERLGELKAQLADLWVVPQALGSLGLLVPTPIAYRREQMPVPRYGREILRAYQILVI